MPRFSSKTEAILTTSGWHEGRKIDASPYVQRLERQGYTVFPVAKEFFEEFGELILRKPKLAKPRTPSWFELIYKGLWPQPNPLSPWLDLRLEESLNRFTLWEPQDFIEELNIAMCPIGHCSDGIIYTIDAQGKVYGLYWPTVLFIGESGELAIERYSTWTPSDPYQVILDDRNEN